ncbi:SoxR reducing system RseC family protein [Chitinibacter bivalviorum]|uniref:SoxR reducing system RseC family protein n=1 Tax=Chitinibacter bivalviorum TaxID=2739434 RepID=A0A7H9BH81_9NEIS|nr:SoxR reducing system RseC family protein [Chitinibacter bivalviorum]QLG87965.1 SoxR reducing system RseC family protein [Chitinibacter bivalviorum]
MIETQAQVVRTEGTFAWVKIRPHSPCGNCDPKTGCKSVAITRLFGNAQENYRVNNPINAAVDDLVTIAVAEGALLKTALWAYGLPLGLLLLGALLGRLSNGQTEMGTLIGAGLGFLAGFAALKLLPKTQMQPAEPFIVSKSLTGQVVKTCELKRTH